MPFSVLLLTGASSARHITGDKGVTVIMPNLASEEVALFFDRVDKDPISRGLGLSNQKCCDGIIFYTNSQAQRVICLVEMKSTDLSDAREQIKNTHKRLSDLLKQECTTCSTHLKQIIWQAYIYHSGSSAKGGYRDHEDDLKHYGFKEAWVRGDRDISKYIRMEVGATLRNKKSRHHSH